MAKLDKKVGKTHSIQKNMNFPYRWWRITKSFTAAFNRP